MRSASEMGKLTSTGIVPSHNSAARDVLMKNAEPEVLIAGA
jgi:hypothetical protein